MDTKAYEEHVASVMKKQNRPDSYRVSAGKVAAALDESLYTSAKKLGRLARGEEKEYFNDFQRMNMKNGVDNEASALVWYGNHMGCVVSNGKKEIADFGDGLFISGIPDGIVHGTNTIVEIKCPSKCKMYGYIIKGKLTPENISRDHYYQMQTYMAMAALRGEPVPFCDYVAYCGNGNTTFGLDEDDYPEGIIHSPDGMLTDVHQGENYGGAFIVGTEEDTTFTGGIIRVPWNPEEWKNTEKRLREWYTREGVVCKSK